MTNVLQGLVAQERIAARKLFDAFERAKNRGSITLRDRQIIRPSESGELNAANPYARILLGNALWTEFSKFFDLSESQPIPEVPLYWLTVVDLGASRTSECWTRGSTPTFSRAPTIRTEPG